MRVHFQELRNRLIIICVVFFAWCGVGYAIHKPLTDFLLKPLSKTVYYTTPQGGFEFFMRVIVTVGFVCTVPVILHQLLRFIEPAAGKKLSKKTLGKGILYSCLLAIVGIIFAYYMILPTSLAYFSQFGGSGVNALISANSYLDMVLGILTTFALIFQLPLVISIIDNIRPIKPEKLNKYRRHVIVGSLVVALILPFTYDPVTQFVIALPIIILYELSIVILRLNHRQNNSSKRDVRIAKLVGAMHEAKQAEVRSTVHINASEASQSPAQPLPIEKSALLVQPLVRKTILVEPTRYGSAHNPRVLDLRNIGIS